MSQSPSELRGRRAELLTRRIPKPSHRHAAPAGCVFEMTTFGYLRLSDLTYQTMALHR